MQENLPEWSLQENPEFVKKFSNSVSLNTNEIIFEEFSANSAKKNKLMFKFMTDSEITLENFKYMIDLGANPNDDMDKLLELSLTYPSTDIANYLMEEYNASLNNATIYRPSVNNFRMLLDHGLIITDMYIDQCFDWQNPDKLEILLEHDVTLKKIMERFVVVPNNSVQYVVACDLIKKVTNSDENFDPVLLNKFMLKLIDYDLSPRQYFQFGHTSHGGRPKNILTTDLVQKIILMGLDVHFDGDNLFLLVCALGDLSMVKFFLEDLGCDINAHDSSALVAAIRKCRVDTAEYLLDSGIKISNRLINEIFIVHNPIFFQLLLKYSDDKESIAQKYFLYKTQITDILKAFVGAGIDVTKMVSDM